MASVAEVSRAPRFGSAAELAAYAGLSVKGPPHETEFKAR